MDFRSYAKDKHGFDNVVVFVDRMTKRPVSIPCHKNIDAKETARIFLTHIYRQKWAPVTLVSDRGSQFISDFWDEFCSLIRTKLKLSTAAHPETDGQTEIVNQYMSQRIRPFVNYFQDDWSEWLPMVDFAASCLPHESTGVSPFSRNVAVNHGCPLTGTRLGNLAQERKGSTGRRPINSCRECKKYGIWSRDRCSKPRSVRRSRRTTTAAKSILTLVIASGSLPRSGGQAALLRSWIHGWRALTRFWNVLAMLTS
jgi:hypothetical protein